jgi:hypothetical protein
MTLEELAEKHLLSIVEFHCDEQQQAFMTGLRELIKEVVGERVGSLIVGDEFSKFGEKSELTPDDNDDTGYWENRGYELKPLHALSVPLEHL